MNNKVLIGITSKNRASILPKAIASGLSQTFPNKQVAVFDDCSTDGTQSLAQQYPIVQWHLSDTEKGYVYARNMFLQTTDAGYYCSLDDDSWFLDSHSLEKAVAYMDGHPQIGALAFKILSPDDVQQSIATGQLTEQPKETNNFIGCGHMLRIDAVKQVGCYTVNPGYYGGEEKDLCIRLMDKGFSIVFFPSEKIWHDKTNVARNQQRQHRSGVCNDLVFAFRRIPLLLMVPVLFYKLFSHIVFSVRYKKAALTKPCLQGFGDFFKFLFSGSTQRKAVSLRTYQQFKQLNNISS